MMEKFIETEAFLEMTIIIDNKIELIGAGGELFAQGSIHT